MAKPKIALVPAAQGSKLFSVLPSSGVGDFTFTRSGKATRINSQGLIEEVSNGQSRLNYPMIDGKVVGCPHHILEPQRTNLITYSEDFSQSSWVKQNVNLTSNYEISPSGNLTADRIITTNIGVDLYQNLLVTANTTYKLSFYTKLRDGENLQARFYDLTNETNISYVDYSSQLSNDEWKRVEVEFTTPSGCVSVRVWLVALTSTLIDASFWGAQLEDGSYPTSYIPTNGSAVTRSAETANDSGDASTFNSSEGVLMAEIAALANDGTNRFISLTNGVTDATNISLAFTTTTNQIRVLVDISYALQMSITYTVNSVLDFNKIILKYKENDFALWVNGFEVGTDSSGTVPTANYITDLSFERVNSLQFYGKTKQIQYYNSALTDSELEQLTSWTSFTDMANGQLYSIQ